MMGRIGDGRPLSRREREVLELAARNLTNKEIAFELGLAAATVRVLLVRAAEKLGARGRNQAVAHFCKGPTRSL
jgi:DNA-binding CsgD family transcriptional regulator